MLFLRLYVAGQTARSVLAIANLKIVLSDLSDDLFTVETIDLITNPERGLVDQIIAIPSLVRVDTNSSTKVIGDLSNIEFVRLYLDLPVKKNN